ncbi:tail fiber protein [Acetobacteraceae bacterium]|nr:tail fiber protein [Acetobacteraceae bacterium]
MFLVSDRAKASLAANITPTDTQIQLASGTGSKFPIPQGSPADNGESGFFALTLVSAGSGVYEICHCTHRDQDILTVERGCEGTIPRAFITGDPASLNDTAARIRGASQYGYLGVFSPWAISNNAIPGYAAGALLVDSSGLFFWQNLKDQNNAAPGSDDSWLKVDFQHILKSIQGGSYPIGASLIWNGVDNPTQGTWLEEDGSQYDTTQYPLLYNVLKSDHLPNSSGRFIRCSNNKGGQINPDNTSLNSVQTSAVNAQDNVTINIPDSGFWAFTGGAEITPQSPYGCFQEVSSFWDGKFGTHKPHPGKMSKINMNLSGFKVSISSGNETRPSAITKRFLIRAA